MEVRGYSRTSGATSDEIDTSYLGNRLLMYSRIASSWDGFRYEWRSAMAIISTPFASKVATIWSSESGLSGRST